MDGRVLHQETDTIVGGISMKVLSKEAQRTYMRQVLVPNFISSNFTKRTTGEPGANIVFFEKDALSINPHGNDPLVITSQHLKMDIRCVRIDLGSSIDVLF